MAPTQTRKKTRRSENSQPAPSERAGESVPALHAEKREVECAAARVKAARAALDHAEKALAALQEAKEGAMLELEAALDGKRKADLVLENGEKERHVMDFENTDSRSCGPLKICVHEIDEELWHFYAGFLRINFLGDGFFLSCRGGTVKMWELSSGLCTKTFSSGIMISEEPRCIGALQNGNFIAGTTHGKVIAWDSVTRDRVRTIHRGHGSGTVINSVAVVNRDTFLSGSSVGTIKLWTLPTGDCISTYDGHDQGVLCISIITTDHVVSGSDDGQIKFWKLSTGATIRTYEAQYRVNTIAIVDQQQFLSTSIYSIKLWKTSHEESMRTFVGHDDRVNDIAVVDTDRFVSGSDDRTIKLWSLVQGACIYTYRGQNSRILSLSLVENKKVLSGDRDGKIMLWKLP